LFVVDALAMDAPKTKAIQSLLSAIGITRRPLVVTSAGDRMVLLSARNIEGASALPATHINTEAILKHHGVVMTVDAVRQVEALWGGDRVKGRRASLPVVAAAESPPPATPARRRRAAPSEEA